VTNFAVVVGEKTFERIRHPVSAGDRRDDSIVRTHVLSKMYGTRSALKNLS